VPADLLIVNGRRSRGLGPGEAPQALAPGTLGPAFAAHAETRRGMIEVGRDADVVVLDRDLLVEDRSAIVGTGVVVTVVGGRIVHGEGAA
jgi:predicted amidohydrolase YtcJ